VNIDGRPMISFTSQPTQAKADAQQDWMNFQDHPIGTLSLEKGRRELAIIPQKGQSGWNVAIKRIVLKKVK